MFCPPGQSFVPFLRDCVTHDDSTYQQYQALRCQGKNMFFDGKKCVSVNSSAGQAMYDDFLDGFKNPDQYGNRDLFDKLSAEQARQSRCKGQGGLLSNPNDAFVFAGECFDRKSVLHRLEQSLAANLPFFVVTNKGDYYYPSAQEVARLYKSFVQEQQRRGQPVNQLPVVPIDHSFLAQHEIRFFVTPYTQRFLHIVLVHKVSGVSRTLGFIPRVKPVGLPAYLDVHQLKKLIMLAYNQGRLIDSQYNTRVPELPGTSDPWNAMDATEKYIQLFENMVHMTQSGFLIPKNPA